MTTSDETVATEVAELTELSAKHLAFKQRAMEVAHEYATKAGHCEIFDQVLHDLGIPGRDRFYDNSNSDNCDDPACSCNSRIRRVRPTLVGEETEAEFNAWKYRTTKKLYDEASHYGIVTITEPMAQAGFPTRTDLDAMRRRVLVEISGKFTFTTPVETIEGVDLIEFINTSDFPRLFRSALGAQGQDDGGVVWKATVVESRD